MNMWAQKQKQQGFTIVELLIVVVVIAILAAITIVAYNGINDRSRESSAKSAVQQAYKQVEAKQVTSGAYPVALTDVNIVDGSTTFGYTRLNNNTEMCVSAQTGTKQFSMQKGVLLEGDCGQVVASYYNDTTRTNLVVKRAENRVANNWAAGSPDPRVPTDSFSAKYEMRIIPPVTDTYTFYTNTDDYAQLIVDGQTVIPWTAAGVRDATSTTVNLTAGQPVSVEYSMWENGGLAYATLFWSYTGQARVTIPASQYLRP